MSKNLKVVMTRTSDVFIPLNERANISNRAGAKVFMSIHLNAFNGTATGTETLLHTNSKASEALATTVNNNLVNTFGLSNRGVKRANLAVLRGTYQRSLAVLTETAFIDNGNDAGIIKRSDFVESAAQAHASAILSVTKDGDVVCLDPGHGGHDPGAVGNGLQEKDVVLQIALKTREILLGRAADKTRRVATVIYNDNKVEGFVQDGTSYAPMRPIAELVGVPVDWDQPNKKAYLAGEPVKGLNVDSRTYLPVRELANKLGLSLAWNQQALTVTLAD